MRPGVVFHITPTPLSKEAGGWRRRLAIINLCNVDALWFKIFGLSLNVTFFLFGGTTAEDFVTTFRGRPLRLGGSGGTRGGWRGGLPRRGGATGASSSAVKAGFRR